MPISLSPVPPSSSLHRLLAVSVFPAPSVAAIMQTRGSDMPSYGSLQAFNNAVVPQAFDNLLLVSSRRPSSPRFICVAQISGKPLYRFAAAFATSPPSRRSSGPIGNMGATQTGHIARREFKRRLERHAEGRAAFHKQSLEEKQCRIALRQSRVVSDTFEELIEYFLDTGAQEIEFEIARLRPRICTTI